MKALTPNKLYNSVNDRVTELRQLRKKLINDLIKDEGAGGTYRHFDY